jgi:hypothetical protein
MVPDFFYQLYKQIPWGANASQSVRCPPNMIRNNQPYSDRATDLSSFSCWWWKYHIWTQLGTQGQLLKDLEPSTRTHMLSFLVSSPGSRQFSKRRSLCLGAWSDSWLFGPTQGSFWTDLDLVRQDEVHCCQLVSPPRTKILPGDEARAVSQGESMVALIGRIRDLYRNARQE